MSMDNLSVTSCPIHSIEPNRHSLKLCHTCGFLVCEECEKNNIHITHEVESLKDIHKNNTIGFRFPKEPYLLIPQICEAEENIKIKGKKAQYKWEKINSNLNIEKKLFNKIMVNKNYVLEKEYYYLEMTLNFLDYIKNKSKTFSFKNACRNAMSLFDIEKKIKIELRDIRASIKRLNEKRDKWEIMVKKHYISMLQLECIKSNCIKKKFDENGYYSLLLLDENNILDRDYSMNKTVYNFKAFPFVERYFNINTLMNKTKIKRNNIWGSGYITVNMGLRSCGRHFVTSLSHNGILSIYSTTKPFEKHYNYKPGDRKNIIQFTNLKNNRQVELEVEEMSNVAYYDERMILLTQGRDLREVEVDKIFEKQHLSLFKKIEGTGRISYSADTTLVQSRRMLIYTKIDCVPYEYNVDTGYNKRIAIGYKVHKFCSLMGIEVNAKGIFQDKTTKFTYVLNFNNTVSLLRGNREEGITTFFISSRNPKKLKKGAIKYGNYFVVNNRKIYTKSWLWFERNISILRIYKDIFLVYNYQLGRWCTCRLSIV